MAKEIGRKLKIYVNSKEVTTTITGMRKSLAKLRSQANKEIVGSDKWKKYNTEVAKTEVELSKAYTAQKAFKEETKLAEKGITTNQQALAKFTSSFSDLFQGAKNGDFLQMQSGFNGIKAGIKGATKAAWAFIATPIGATIALLAGVGLAAKQWFDYNNQVTQALQLTTQLTGLTDKAADQARIRAEVITETFGGDFKENMIQARSLVTQFGISYDEAFDTIEKQLVRGQSNNEEFGKSIKEYATFFAGAKFSADEFGKVIAAGYDLGFYDDKLPDAIKEFDLAIKKQTPATRDALINAFGKPFTDDILKRVRKGETSTKDALKEMSKQADKTGLNLQQNAQLTADLVKGAGEDAGGAVKIFETLDVALNTEIRALKESEQIKQDQINTTKELKKITSSLFASGDKGWGLLVSKGKLFATQTLVKILKGGIDVYNWFIDLNNESGAFSAILTSIGAAASFGFSIIGTLVDGAWSSFKSLGDIVAGIFTLDWDRIKAGFATGVSGITDALSEIKDKGIESGNEVYDAFQGNNKKKRLNIDDFTGSDPGVTPDNPSGDKPTGLSPEEKAGIDQRRKVFEEAEKSLTDFIKKQKAERDLLNKTSLEKELAAIDQKYAQEIEKAQGHDELLKELEALRDQEKTDLKLQRKQEEVDRIKEFEDELAIEEEEQRLEEEALAEETEEERIMLLLAKTKWVADQQISIERKKELERLKIIGATEKEIALVKKKYALKQNKLDVAFAADKKQLRKNELDWDKLTEDQKLNLVKSGLSQAANLFNKHTAAYKAIKISETLITTYQSAVNSYNSLSSIPIVGPVLGGLAAAAAVATGIAQVRKIASTKKEKMPSYARGGYTGTGSLGLGSNKGGEIRGVVEEDEYVIPKFVRQDPEVIPVLEYLEAKRTGSYNSFANGGDSSVDTNAVGFRETNTLPATNNNLEASIERLNQNLENGLTIIYTLENEIERRELAQKLDDTIQSSIN